MVKINIIWHQRLDGNFFNKVHVSLFWLTDWFNDELVTYALATRCSAGRAKGSESCNNRWFPPINRTKLPISPDTNTEHNIFNKVHFLHYGSTLKSSWKCHVNRRRPSALNRDLESADHQPSADASRPWIGQSAISWWVAPAHGHGIEWQIHFILLEAGNQSRNGRNTVNYPIVNDAAIKQSLTGRKRQQGKKK